MEFSTRVTARGLRSMVMLWPKVMVKGNNLNRSRVRYTRVEKFMSLNRSFSSPGLYWIIINYDYYVQGLVINATGSQRYILLCPRTVWPSRFFSPSPQWILSKSTLEGKEACNLSHSWNSFTPFRIFPREYFELVRLSKDKGTSKMGGLNGNGGREFINQLRSWHAGQSE